MSFVLLSKDVVTREIVTGRFADGSDRAIVIYSVYVCNILDDSNQYHRLEFTGDPTDAQILARLPRATVLVPVSKADLEIHMNTLYQVWKRWHETHAEAVIRLAPANVITALLNRRDATWNDYVTAINSWRVAT